MKMIPKKLRTWLLAFATVLISAATPLLFGGAVVLTSCTTEEYSVARPTIERIQQRGKLLVGTTGDYRPLTFREPETGEYWGFGIEVAQAIADSIGVPVEFVRTSWPTLTADVMITEITEAPYYVQTDPRLAAPLLNAPFTHGEIGVLMRKGQDDLLELVNGVIRRMKAAGLLQRLCEKYGLMP